MSIASSVKTLVRRDNSVSELEAMQQAHRELTERIIKSEATLAELKARLAAKQSTLADLALDADHSGDATAYNKARSELTQLQSTIDLTADLIDGLEAKRQDTFQTISTLAFGKNVKLFEKLCKARMDAAAEVEAAAEALTVAHRKLLDKSHSVLVAWPGSVPYEMGLTIGAIDEALSVHLYKINPTSPLDRNGNSPLPAPANGTFLDMPAKLPSLSDRVQQDNEAILSELKKALAKQGGLNG